MEVELRDPAERPDPSHSLAGPHHDPQPSDDEELFEAVVLGDLSDPHPYHRSQPSVSFSQDPVRSSAASDYSSPAGDLDIRPPCHRICPSSSFTSFDSSTAESCFKPRSKPAMSDIPSELVHLIDAAIMGRADSVDKIKTMVSTDSPDTARSVVDALLATMGGVEGLDKPAPTSSTPASTMLSSRAAVVTADLIPWLPLEGDSDFYLSPRTRMVKGLLVILRSCTRNRTMCSASGVLRVLLQSAEKLFVDSTDRVQWDGTPLC